ncbi:hypothetical protein CYMTET_26452 [Cymbomonas tetramitiformis]|uniref:Uncharacterized protein n=1 Tax=Cymbomonas tetramitiformis TaxID=36881 RepID=A0AAE0KY58_9CHLO|nr:hypothetical protein CYMTET_26452 [Cymbomonas tetramitiformis]
MSKFVVQLLSDEGRATFVVVQASKEDFEIRSASTKEMILSLKTAEIQKARTNAAELGRNTFLALDYLTDSGETARVKLSAPTGTVECLLEILQKERSYSIIEDMRSKIKTPSESANSETSAPITRSRAASRADDELPSQPLELPTWLSTRLANEASTSDVATENPSEEADESTPTAENTDGRRQRQTISGFAGTENNFSELAVQSDPSKGNSSAARFARAADTVIEGEGKTKAKRNRRAATLFVSNEVERDEHGAALQASNSQRGKVQDLLSMFEAEAKSTAGRLRAKTTVGDGPPPEFTEFGPDTNAAVLRAAFQSGMFRKGAQESLKEVAEGGEDLRRLSREQDSQPVLSPILAAAAQQQAEEGHQSLTQLEAEKLQAEPKPATRRDLLQQVSASPEAQGAESPAHSSASAAAGSEVARKSIASPAPSEATRRRSFSSPSQGPAAPSEAKRRVSISHVSPAPAPSEAKRKASISSPSQAPAPPALQTLALFCFPGSSHPPAYKETLALFCFPGSASDATRKASTSSSSQGSSIPGSHKGSTISSQAPASQALQASALCHFPNQHLSSTRKPSLSSASQAPAPPTYKETLALFCFPGSFPPAYKETLIPQATRKPSLSSASQAPASPDATRKPSLSSASQSPAPPDATRKTALSISQSPVPSTPTGSTPSDAKVNGAMVDVGSAADSLTGNVLAKKDADFDKLAEKLHDVEARLEDEIAMRISATSAWQTAADEARDLVERGQTSPGNSDLQASVLMLQQEVERLQANASEGIQQQSATETDPGQDLFRAELEDLRQGSQQQNDLILELRDTMTALQSSLALKQMEAQQQQAVAKQAERRASVSEEALGSLDEVARQQKEMLARAEQHGEMLEAMLAERDEEVSRLQDEGRHREQELQALEQQLQAAQWEQLKTLDREADTQHQEESDLKRLLSQALERIAGLQAELEEKTIQIQHAEAQVQEVEAKAEQAEAKVERVEIEMDALQARLEARERSSEQQQETLVKTELLLQEALRERRVSESDVALSEVESEPERERYRGSIAMGGHPQFDVSEVLSVIEMEEYKALSTRQLETHQTRLQKVEAELQRERQLRLELEARALSESNAAAEQQELAASEVTKELSAEVQDLSRLLDERNAQLMEQAAQLAALQGELRRGGARREAAAASRANVALQAEMGEQIQRLLLERAEIESALTEEQAQKAGLQRRLRQLETAYESDMQELEELRSNLAESRKVAPVAAPAAAEPGPPPLIPRGAPAVVALRAMLAWRLRTFAVQEGPVMAELTASVRALLTQVSMLRRRESAMAEENVKLKRELASARKEAEVPSAGRGRLGGLGLGGAASPISSGAFSPNHSISKLKSTLHYAQRSQGKSFNRFDDDDDDGDSDEEDAELPVLSPRMDLANRLRAESDSD